MADSCHSHPYPGGSASLGWAACFVDGCFQGLMEFPGEHPGFNFICVRAFIESKFDWFDYESAVGVQAFVGW